MGIKYAITLILIWMMVSCGEKDIIKTFSSDSHPAVSPDGRWITYCFNIVDGAPKNYPSSGLYVISIDGKEENLLYPEHDVIPSCWSPDGKQIATSKGIYTIENNIITDFRPNNEINLFSPSWSPDGKFILYFNFLGKVFLCDTLFDNIRELPFWAIYTRWMPDGKHITCLMPLSQWGDPEICIINTLGSDTVRITHNGGDVWDPVPSPDGTMIAWCKTDGIYVMNLDSTNKRLLDSGTYPAWTPDSKYIVYTKGDNPGGWGSEYIWKISIDGKEKVQITKNHEL